MRRHLSLLALSAIPSLCAGQDDIDLWRSIVAGDVRTVTTYLQGGGDPNAEVRSPQGEPWRILKVALFDREQSVALALIQGGADFELLDVSLSTVVAEGMTDVFKALVAQRPGRLTESIARDPESILFPAASRGYGDMLQAVLEETARRRITWPPDVFTEGISAAISFRQNDLARSLLRYGARPTGTVLRVASRDGSAGIVRTLLQYGIDPMARLPESSVDPSIGARRAMEYAAVRYRNARNAYEREAARLIAVELTAAGAANENLVTHKPLFDGGLLKRGTVQQKPSERLLYAARYGYVEEVSSLLSQKAVDRDAIHRATIVALERLQNDVAQILIDTEVPLNEGVLLAAARGDSPGIVRKLLSLGADPNAVVDGSTPLEQWWERSQKTDFGVAGDYVLHELIAGGAAACWLFDHASQLNVVAQSFLTYDATECRRGR